MRLYSISHDAREGGRKVNRTSRSNGRVLTLLRRHYRCTTARRDEGTIYPALKRNKECAAEAQTHCEAVFGSEADVQARGHLPTGHTETGDEEPNACLVSRSQNARHKHGAQPGRGNTAENRSGNQIVRRGTTVSL